MICVKYYSINQWFQNHSQWLTIVQSSSPYSCPSYGTNRCSRSHLPVAAMSATRAHLWRPVRVSANRLLHSGPHQACSRNYCHAVIQSYVIVYTIDFSNAFDTMLHNELLGKYSRMKLPDCVYNWLKLTSFKLTAHGSVVWNQSSSWCQPVSSEVRQLGQSLMSSQVKIFVHLLLAIQWLSSRMTAIWLSQRRIMGRSQKKFNTSGRAQITCAWITSIRGRSFSCHQDTNVLWWFMPRQFRPFLELRKPRRWA